MKQYELTVLIHPDLEARLDEALTKVKGIVTAAGGTIDSEESWGKKKLAYQIERQDYALYHYMEVSLPADAPLKISNIFNITEEVIRYLLVKFDEKGRAALEEAAKKSAEKAAETKEEE